MASKERTNEARLRLGVGLAAVVIVGVVAVLASVYLLADLWAVLSRASTFAAAGVLAVAVAVIVAIVIWVVVVSWTAVTGPRGATIATVAALITLLVVRIMVMYVYDGVLSGEPAVYDRQAAALAAGQCCLWDEAIDRPPGYAFLLGGAYALMGRSALTAEVVNLVFAVAAGLALFSLAGTLYGKRVAPIALLLYAVWPAGALMVGVRMPHTAYDLAFVATAWVAIASPPGWRGSALAGLLLGLSPYLRPTALALLPAIVIARVWASSRLQGWFTQTLLPMSLVALLMLIPVMAWHLSTRDTLDISTSAYGGSSLYHGTNVESEGGWSEKAYQELIAAAGDGQWARSEIGRELAIERVLDDPAATMVLAVRKQGALWGRDAYGVRYGIRRDLASRPYLPKSVLPSLASGTFYAALLLLAAAGLYLRRSRPDALAILIVLTLLTVSAIHALMEVRDRYHSYVIPLLMPIAAYAIAAAIDRFMRHRSEAPPVP